VKLAAAAAAVLVAGSPTASGARYLQSRELANGGYAEPIPS